MLHGRDIKGQPTIAGFGVSASCLGAVEIDHAHRALGPRHVGVDVAGGVNHGVDRFGRGLADRVKGGGGS